MSEATAQFLSRVITTALWPQNDAPIYEWAYPLIKLDASSPIHGNYNIENSPQFKEQFDAFQDEDVRMVTSLGPNQGGRTKAMEIASLWSIVNRPGPMQWNTDTNDKAKDEAEDRWWPLAKSCVPVVEKLPAHGTGLGVERHKEKIRKVIFTDGMPFYVQGCSESNLEQKSIMTQFNDECWQWPVGRLEIAHIRCNVAYAWNYKVWNGSVAGIDGDDIDLLFKSGTQKEWAWLCPKCGRKQLPRWGKPKQRGGIHWERDKKTKPNDREWDYDEVEKTVRYECEHCKEDFDDSARVRRILNESAIYIAQNPKAPYWHQSFRFNILSVNWPGLTWGKWVVEFLKSVEQARRYSNLEPLKKFWTRRMTESWDESRHAMSTHKVVLSDYNLAEPNIYKTQQWEKDSTGIGGEMIRFMGVDKQEWGYPFVIRATTKEGDSRLIERGVGERTCLSSYTEIEAKAKEFGVQPQCVLIDSAYETHEVYAQAVNHGWTCMRGVDREPFRHTKEIVDRNGMVKKVFIELPYSEEQWSDPFSGTSQQQLNRRIRMARAVPKLARRFDWINLHIKNLLSAFKQGQAVYWGVPGNVGADYIRQINAEVRHVIINAKGKRTEWWSNTNAKGTGTKRPNHAWDCECMIVVAMCLQKLINLSDWTPESETQEPQ
jgi:phage terminase large subunit GpA-like protein